MENFDTWIGKKEISTDFVNSRPVEMMQALLNEEFKNLNGLPHLYHWFYFLPTVNGSNLPNMVMIKIELSKKQMVLILI